MTSAVVFIYTEMGYFAINYLDDLGGADLAERAEKAYQELRNLLGNIGLITAANKCCSPSCTIVFLGIEVNSILFTLTIPEEKMQEILHVLKTWVNKTTANLKDVQKLAGLLNFACRCVCSGRVYLARILNFLRDMPAQGQKLIPCDMRMDIEWWIQFAPTFNGVSLMLENTWSLPDACIESDSCLMGVGPLLHKSFSIVFSHAKCTTFVLILTNLYVWSWYWH